jgi:predicted small lipoprotein YifL
MRSIIAVLGLTVLAACGADGPPVAPPEKPAEKPAVGLSISGVAEVGIARVGGQ